MIFKNILFFNIILDKEKQFPPIKKYIHERTAEFTWIQKNN